MLYTIDCKKQNKKTIQIVPNQIHNSKHERHKVDPCQGAAFLNKVRQGKIGEYNGIDYITHNELNGVM